METQRLLLFVTLGFLSLLMWQAWQQDYGVKDVAPVESVAANLEVNNGTKEDVPMDDIPDIEVAASEASTVTSSKNINASTTNAKKIVVVTDNFNIEIDTIGGVISKAELRGYPVSGEERETPLALLFNDGGTLHIAESGLRSKSSPAPTHYSLYQSQQDEYRLSEGVDVLSVPLVWEKDGIRVEKIYRFNRDSFLINVEHKITNNSGMTWSGAEYNQLKRTRDEESSGFIYTYTGGVIYNDDLKYEKYDFDDMEDKRLQDIKTKDYKTINWAAMIQHYFVTAWVPETEGESKPYSFVSKSFSPRTYTLGLRSPSVDVHSQQSFSFNSSLFVGPKLQHELKKIAKGLELTVDYGVLTILADPLFWLLEFFYSLVQNWGFAIILLTIAVKAVFFKLSETSYKSMAKMRTVTPRMKALKERYGDDRQRLNQAMMELYKKEKVNPMGGCLPILVQIPVFIALYWVLLESVEVRQAPFMLWITDLSAKDPYFVLPLIMAASMVIQQKLNPTPIDPIQQKVMSMMPIIFGVFFAFFPSGLVLYWVVNNVLSISQQWVITKRIEKEAK